jgi:hypothetical protein
MLHTIISVQAQQYKIICPGMYFMLLIEQTYG